MELSELYNEVLSYVNKVDLNKLWPNFRLLKFALYNDKECFFNGKYIEKTNEFLGNTSIKYEDEYIAIWNVMGEIDSRILASKMIHEMFHGFQNENKESRFPDEIKAVYQYKYTNENLSLKLKENELIITLLENFNQELFSDLLRLRKYRSVNFPVEFIYETKIEQIEGTANYIELMVLNEIDSKLYLNKIDEMRHSIVEPNRFFPIRIISYNIGALLIKILKDNNISFNQGFDHLTISAELIQNFPILDEIENNYDINEYIHNYYAKGYKVIKENIKDNNIVMEGNEDLLGFNVYNAFYQNNYIISRYFVMYGVKENPTILYGDFVIETKVEGKVNKIYRIITG